jgi:hypothetical protein
MKEPLEAPPLGTPRPGPASNVRRSFSERLLYWTLTAITDADIVALLLMEGAAEALEWGTERVRWKGAREDKDLEI